MRKSLTFLARFVRAAMRRTPLVLEQAEGDHPRSGGYPLLVALRSDGQYVTALGIAGGDGSDDPPEGEGGDDDADADDDGEDGDDEDQDDEADGDEDGDDADEGADEDDDAEEGEGDEESDEDDESDLPDPVKKVLKKERKARREAERRARKAERAARREASGDDGGDDDEDDPDPGTRKLRRANLQAALLEEGYAGGRAKAVARLLDDVEYDENDEPVDLEGALEDAEEVYGPDVLAKGAKPKRKPPRSNAGDGREPGPKPKLTAEELEQAEKAGKSPEEWEALKNVKTLDDYEALRKQQRERASQ